MNIAIFNHPFYDFYTSPKRLYSNILNYLKEIIDTYEFKKNNIVCFDVVKNLKKEIQLVDDLGYLKKYLNNDITNYSFFKEYYQFGDINNFNHKILKKFNPDIFIVSSFAYCYFDGLKAIIEYLKKLYNIPVICGGHGPSSNPEFYLKNTFADYVIVGPAELSLNKLLECIDLKKKIEIENVYFKGNNPKINLDKKYDLRTFIDIKKDNIIHIQLTRGCPKNCSYCSVKIISGKKFRKVSFKQFEKDIAALKLNGKVHFDFEDDNISFDQKYFFNIIKIIKKHYNDFTFSFENGIDFTTLDKEIIDELINNGIKQWNISLATINSEILQVKGRGYLIDQFDKIISYLEQYEQQIIVYFICGLIDDNAKNILDTLKYLASKRVVIGISPFYPVPNTKEALKIKTKIFPVFSKATSFYKWSKINTKEQVTFFILSRFINAIKRIKIREREDFNNKNIVIKNNKIICDKLTKIEISLIGILISFKRKKIVYVDNDFKLVNHDLDKVIIKKFYNAVDHGLKIRNIEGYYLDKDFLKI